MSAVHRVSSSWRADHLGSPGPRSRSQEPGKRKGDDEHEHNELSSERVVTTRHEIRRAMSDPFENGGGDEDEEELVSKSLFADDDPAVEACPTLSRFPVAETRNLNCWSEPNINIFYVRGTTYLVDQKKISSGPYLLPARGCDLFLTKEPPANIGRNPAILAGALRKLPTFLLNFRFPWGVLVLYFEIPSKFRPFLKPHADEHSMEGMKPHADEHSMEGMTAAERTLATFFMADEAEKNSSLKLIPYVAKGPWIVRNMVIGKPAIIGNKLPVTYTYEPAKNEMAEYLEADLDIGNSSATARRIVSVCRRYMNSLTCDIGFVVQGNSENELPEQMLGSVRIHGVDPLKAPTL